MKLEISSGSIELEDTFVLFAVPRVLSVFHSVVIVSESMDFLRILEKKYPIAIILDGRES
jgi:hypothetical protein